MKVSMVSLVFRRESANSLLDSVITCLIEPCLLYKRLKKEFDGNCQKPSKDDCDKSIKSLSSRHVNSLNFY